MAHPLTPSDPALAPLRTGPTDTVARSGHDDLPTRLLSAAAPAGQPPTLAGHLARCGPTPYLGDPRLLAPLVEAAGLTGRGGAGFPTHRKLRAVAAAPGRAVVVGNGAEGEPASAKDRLLLTRAPHLVLDGVQLAAQAVDAGQAYLYVARRPDVVAAVRGALAERAAAGTDRIGVRLVTAPVRYLSGEESALAARVSGGPARPRFVPPRVYQRGVHGQPTLVQNVETLAHLALIARWGPDWFREFGPPEQPGTMLFTVSGAVARPGVVEAAVGTSLGRLLAAAGGVVGRAGGILLGGYHGTWWVGEQVAGLRLSTVEVRRYGGSLGSGVVAVLPGNSCGLAETARVVRYLADQSAGQCGPCHNGLPLLADTLAVLAVPTGPAGPIGTPGWAVRSRTEELMALVDRRGACHHPDGSVRLVRSALRAFASELANHEHGFCVGVGTPGVLPVPAPPPGVDSWR